MVEKNGIEYRVGFMKMYLVYKDKFYGIFVCLVVNILIGY